MGWMDVTLTVILIVNGISGWKRGLVLSLFQLLGFVAAWFAAKTYYQVLTAYIIDKTNFLSKIQLYLSTKLENADYESAFLGGNPDGRNIFEIIRLPKVLEEFLPTTVAIDYGTKVVEGFYHYMAGIMAKLFIDFLSFFVIFMMVKILLTIVAHTLNRVAKLPVINGFNQLGGAILGTFKGLIIVFLLMALLIPFAAISDKEILKEGLEKSFFTRMLYEYNPIINFMR